MKATEVWLFANKTVYITSVLERAKQFMVLVVRNSRTFLMKLCRMNYEFERYLFIVTRFDTSRYNVVL